MENMNKPNLDWGHQSLHLDELTKNQQAIHEDGSQQNLKVKPDYSEWGNKSLPTMMNFDAMKNHQVHKSEVRHFISSPTQRQRKQIRRSSLPTVNYKESRWHNSTSESTAVHSKRPLPRKHIHSSGKNSKGDSTSKNPKKKRGSRKSANNHALSSSAHELRTGIDLLGEERGSKSGGHKKKALLSANKQWSSSSHNDEVQQSSSSGLFEGDSFIGTMPLGGTQEVFEQKADPRKEEYSRGTTAPPIPSPVAGSWSPSKQPMKSAMRRKRKDSSVVDPNNKDSKESSFSWQDDQAPGDRDSTTSGMESSGSTMASAVMMSLAPTLSSPDSRWASNSLSRINFSPTTSRAPVRPGRTKSDDSLSLSAGPPPLVDDDYGEFTENNDDASSASSNSSSVDVDGAITDDGQAINAKSSSLHLSASEINEVPKQTERMQLKEFEETPSRGDESISNLETNNMDPEAVLKPPSPRRPKSWPTGRPQRQDDILIRPADVEGLNITAASSSQDELKNVTTTPPLPENPAGVVHVRRKRRGSTGALVEQWEEQFPNKTPVAPRPAPSTPAGNARKRFNHRRRGSFGIYANVGDDVHDEVRHNPPAAVPMEPIKAAGSDDEYDLFLTSGASGDFASWLEERHQGEKSTALAAASSPRQDSRPPRARRGSTGALAQRWEEELLPKLKSTSPTQSTPTQVDKRRGSESRRRSSMGVLVKKWEKLTISPASSPKKAVEMGATPETIVDRYAYEEPPSLKMGVPISDSETGTMEINDETPLPPLPRKEKRRGSTGTLIKKRRKDREEISAAPLPVSEKQHKRRGSTGRMADSVSHKKKHSPREKGTKSKSRETGSDSNVEAEDQYCSVSPTSEQSAGEASSEELSKRMTDMGPLNVERGKKKKVPKSDGMNDSNRSTNSEKKKTKARKSKISSPTKSPKLKNPKVKKHLPKSRQDDIPEGSASSESMTLTIQVKKKKSQSIANLKVKKKESSTSGRRKSQSDSVVISVADSAKIKEKKVRSRGSLLGFVKKRTPLSNSG
jgi:hypothetical protein